MSDGIDRKLFVHESEEYISVGSISTKVKIVLHVNFGYKI